MISIYINCRVRMHDAVVHMYFDGTLTKTVIRKVTEEYMDILIYLACAV